MLNYNYFIQVDFLLSFPRRQSLLAGIAWACGTSFALLNYCSTFLLFWLLVFVTGKVYSLDENSSLGSIDSEYDMGSIQRDIKFLEDTPSLKEMVLTNQQAPRMTAPFIGLRPANPAMQALAFQKRETHNRSPVSFREGRRASDTSLTQGNENCCPDTLYLDRVVSGLHAQKLQATLWLGWYSAYLPFAVLAR